MGVVGLSFFSLPLSLFTSGSSTGRDISFADFVSCDCESGEGEVPFFGGRFFLLGWVGSGAGSSFFPKPKRLLIAKL